MQNNLILSINGVLTPASSVSDDLVRAVIISLFTWRSASQGDKAEGQVMGWWGDAYASISNDKIGARLWLLGRAKITADTFNLAAQYAQEALLWMKEDGVAARVDVAAERAGKDGLALTVAITRNDGSVLPIRFDNVWGALNV